MEFSFEVFLEIAVGPQKSESDSAVKCIEYTYNFIEGQFIQHSLINLKIKWKK